MTILQMMDLSTAHITQVTSERLTLLDEIKSIYAVPHDFGWFVYVPDEIEPDTPLDLAEVMIYARRNKCSWIKFDCDGLVDENLPVYNW